MPFISLSFCAGSMFLDDDLRVPVVGLVLPSRGAHSDNTIEDLLLLFLSLSSHHDFLQTLDLLDDRPYFVVDVGHFLFASLPHEGLHQ